MLRRIALLVLAASLALPLVAQDAAALTGTDPNDVPLGTADVLESGRRPFISGPDPHTGVPMVSFRVDFEEPTGDAYSLVSIRIDARSGPAFDYSVLVNVTPGEDGYVCVQGARFSDVLRTCHVRTTSPDLEGSTWWRVALKRSRLRATKKLGWWVGTDSDFGDPDRAPDSGFYR